MDVKINRNEACKQQLDKRPPSSLSTGSSDSGVFASGVHASSQPTEPSSAAQTGPPSPTQQQNQIHHQNEESNDLTSLIYHAANLIAVNEQFRNGNVTQSNNLLNRTAEIENISPHQQHFDAMKPELLMDHSPRSLMPGPPRVRAGGAERRMQKPESFKTVICQAWLESKTCAFAENCRFAHGEEELRPSKVEPRQNNKYKTKLCDKYTTTGLCPYGKRCLFIHPDHGPNAYIRADKLFEVSQRHAMADLRDKMESQIMTGTVTRRPPVITPSPILRPSTPVENMPPQKMAQPLGPTPLRVPRYLGRNQPTPPQFDELSALRPHPSWPLEPNSFFTNDTNKIGAISRPVSPFESMLIAASVGPYTSMLGATNSTPGGVSGYASGGSTPYQDLEASPYSPNIAALTQQFLSSAAIQPSSTAPLSSRCFEDDSFSMVPGGFDHLAEDMAKHLDLW
ncbi:unnamed protein product [Caenorhabditis angaria]|uniref:C3H1-type domain-containing protein n=1 Tax=Caenorhabditis angaria TaxID=860376 RepID=A0A9P1MVC0_9PELO|nr:unnamed protein product [Caenorhabditis angaria]